MESSGEEWQVVKPKKQRKKKEEKPASGSPKAKPSSAEAKSKSKGGKEKSASSSPPPPNAQPKKSGEHQKAKKSEQKKASIMKMPLNTREQMAFFIKELVINTPPPSNRLAIAAIGEKIIAVTKNSWNKKYKSSFGSLRSFIESQKDLFVIVGDDVYLDGTVRPPSPAKPSNSVSPKTKAEPVNKRQTGKQEAVAKAPARVQKKSTKASHHSASHEENGYGCLKALAVTGLLGAVILFTLASVNAIDLKSLQRLAQQQFTFKR